MSNDLEFLTGEKAKWIVGFPSDMDNCEVVSKNSDGTYKVKFQVYGSGPWHEGVGYPNDAKMSGLFKGSVEHNFYEVSK
jgi:hypothetical protein